LTQSDSGYTAAKALQSHTVDQTYFHQPSRFVFGKAHVDANVTGDVFAAIKPDPIAYVPGPGYRAATLTRPTLELGGPLHFYRQFLPAHGMKQLVGLTPPEVEAGVSTRVTVPLLIVNPGSKVLHGKVVVDLPAGWTLESGADNFEVPAGQTLAKYVTAIAPAKIDAIWKDITIRANGNNELIGQTAVRVRVVQGSLPQ
jgi:hypothetical protein